jgi:hypothetical protein
MLSGLGEPAPVRDKARGDGLPRVTHLPVRLEHISVILQFSHSYRAQGQTMDSHFSLFPFLCPFFSLFLSNSIQFPGVQPPLAQSPKPNPIPKSQVHDGALPCPPPITPQPDQSSPSWNDRAATRFDYLILIIFQAP